MRQNRISLTLTVPCRRAAWVRLCAQDLSTGGPQADQAITLLPLLRQATGGPMVAGLPLSPFRPWQINVCKSIDKAGKVLPFSLGFNS